MNKIKVIFIVIVLVVIYINYQTLDKRSINCYVENDVNTIKVECINNASEVSIQASETLYTCKKGNDTLECWIE